jgi:glutamate N-acetyltransferase/amino-acid N-acetyltransferase
MNNQINNKLNISELPGGLENVPGYRYSAVECGIRYENRLDYCLISSDNPCAASGVFTTNKVSAAPVKLSRSRINNTIRAVLINATNANACTGKSGLQTAKNLTNDIAKKLGVSASSVLMASTGVIGRELPEKKMLGSHNALVAGLDNGNGQSLSRAIMTTDTVPKSVAYKFSTSKGDFTIAGTAKGSGMIAPNMATLLAFIVTDAPILRLTLDRIFKKTISLTLNSISIDGDVSTNDTAVILSTMSKNPISARDDIEVFSRALFLTLTRLSEMLVADAEGATKLVRIRVNGAKNDRNAMSVARSVAQSLLVKTALFGNDPNWGRIACAAGYSNAKLEENRLTIAVGGVRLLAKGSPVPFDRENVIAKMKEKSVDIEIDLGLGVGRAVFLTCDLSHEYVSINAEYST